MASSFNKEVALIFYEQNVNCKSTGHQSLFALPVTYTSVTDGAAYKN